MRAGICGHVAAMAIALLGGSVAWAQVQVNAPGVYVGVGRTPWFSDPALRKELKLEEAQYDRLVRDYNRAWESYHKGVTELKKDLNEEQRRLRMQELSNSFYGTFSKSVDDAFADDAARRRYNQLYWQYRGYAAFDDPVLVKKLDLTAEQRAALRRYDAEYQRELREMRRDYANDRDAVGRRFANWWRQTRSRINDTLNDRQRQAWSEFIGDPYDFPVTVYVSE